MQKTILAALALAAAAAASARAQERATQEPITLGDALRRAAAGNLDLKRERILVQVAEAQVFSAAGTFDFQLHADLNFSRRTTPPLTASDIFGGFTNTLSSNVALSRLLETGGSLRLSVQQSTTNTNSSSSCGTFGGPGTNCTYYGNNLNLSFNHPLLRGFGAEIVQANIRRQRIQQDQALLNRQMRAANVLRDVITSYWELTYATRDLAIRQSAVDLAKEQLRVTNAQIEVGRLAPVDAAAVERAISDRQQEVVISEQNRFFRTLELRRLFGMPTDPALPTYDAMDAPTATARDVDIRLEIAHALETNPQLRAIRMGIHLSEIDVQTALSTLKPQLDLNAQVGATGRKASFGQTLAQTFGLDDMTWQAGLSLDVPLENRLARGQVRVAQLNQERSRLEAGDLEYSLRDMVMRLGTNIRTASSRVALARATVGFAEKNLEAEKARFTVGRSTNNDVLLRQQELKNAEIQVVRATVDLLISETALSAATGDILEQYGIVLKGT